MTNSDIHTKDEINKIGNTIVYLAQHIPNLSKTKLLKLLYLLDEASVKEFAVPFLNLEYYVWQAGPVATEIFGEISHEFETSVLDQFLRLRFQEINQRFAIFIEPKKEFDDNEFSDNDITILEKFCEKFKDITAEQLVEITHRKNTLWYQIALKNNLLRDFENKRKTTSNYKIDLSELLNDAPEKKAFYQEQLNFIDFSKNFKD
jgi:uncharacterized phage-associated protein